MDRSQFNKIAVLLFLLFMTIGSNLAFAGTDDARVLGGISRETNIYTYLNTYPYSLWKSNHQYSNNDLYLSKDHCVAVDLWDDVLGQIFLLGPGYATDKGIEVGMEIKDIVRAYGPFYADGKEPKDRTLTFGIYHDNQYSKKYRAYSFIEYVAPKNEGINFVLDKKTNKIILIMYQANRHGNGNVMEYVDYYKLLPEKN